MTENSKRDKNPDSEDNEFIKHEKAENHAPLNVSCSKCGRIYCDHENKY